MVLSFYASRLSGQVSLIPTSSCISKHRECSLPKYFQELEKELAEKRCGREGLARMTPGLHPLGALGGSSGLQHVRKVGRILE